MPLIWPPALLLLSLPLFHAPTNRLLELAAAGHPLLSGGFIFLLSGLLGESMKAALSKRRISPAGLFYLSFMWWLSGAASAMIFPLAGLGVTWSQAAGILPGGGFSAAKNPVMAVITSFFFTTPFFTALLLNFMAVPLWILRRVILSAAAFETQYAWPETEGAFIRAVKRVNWAAFVRGEIWQILCLRLPLSTIALMMPEKYWLYLAGWLLIVIIMIGNSGRGGK